MVLNFTTLLQLLLLLTIRPLSSASIFWSCSPVILVCDDVITYALCFHISFNTLIWVAKLFFRMCIPAMNSTLTNTIGNLWSSACLDLIYAFVADFNLVPRY